ncbi:hypothetical protein [Kitasatospora sp. NPDC059571]|uniref:hypothetical protein n=1 Tax=Kitasatospora sp. NPDC059571 TaxID=3346871 RepID=UPI0036BF0163
MTFTDPLAGKGVASTAELQAAALAWDTYDERRDGPAHMPFFYTAMRYENWWGAGATREELYSLANKHGIPVAWTPPARVLRDLVDAGPSHQAKLSVLEAAEDEVRAHCHALMDECTSSWVETGPEVGRHVLAAWDDGHRQAAACLALAAAEDVMFAVARVDRSQKCKGLTTAASRPLLKKPWLVDRQIALAPIEPLFTQYFPEKNNPIPETLSRHAVLHRLPLEHLNTGHSIVAIMLLVSLMRQAEQQAFEAEVDAQYYEED